MTRAAHGLSRDCNFHRHDNGINSFREVELDQMPQHFGLDIDLQSRRLNIHVVPDHLRGSIKLDRVESFVRLYEGGDIDLELVEGCVTIPDGKRVLDDANAIQNGILQG